MEGFQVGNKLVAMPGLSQEDIAKIEEQKAKEDAMLHIAFAIVFVVSSITFIIATYIQSTQAPDVVVIKSLLEQGK